jgi:AP-1 complex subunit sigma 1/2
MPSFSCALFQNDASPSDSKASSNPHQRTAGGKRTKFAHLCRSGRRERREDKRGKRRKIERRSLPCARGQKWTNKEPSRAEVFFPSFVEKNFEGHHRSSLLIRRELALLSPRHQPHVAPAASPSSHPHGKRGIGEERDWRNKGERSSSVFFLSFDGASMEFFPFPFFFQPRPESLSSSCSSPSTAPSYLSISSFFCQRGEQENIGDRERKEEKRSLPPSPSKAFLALNLSPPPPPPPNLSQPPQFRFILLLSRQGKVRLSKWYITAPPRERARLTRDLCAAVLGRPLRGTCNVIEGCDASSSPLLGPLPSGGTGGGAYPGSEGACAPAKIVYRRYASLYFVAGIDGGDNELLALEGIHLLVEALDLYFGNVCELDLVFNFHKAHWLVDELVVGGRLVEPSRRAAVRAAEAQDRAVEEAKAEQGIVESALGTDEV